MNLIRRLEKIEGLCRTDLGVPLLCRAIEIARSGDRDEAITMKAELEQELDGSPKTQKTLMLAHAVLVAFLGHYEP
jgi:hypothetical protein